MVMQVAATSLEEVLQLEAEHSVESSFLDRSEQSNLYSQEMAQSLRLGQNHNLTFVDQSASTLVVQQQRCMSLDADFVAAAVPFAFPAAALPAVAADYEDTHGLADARDWVEESERLRYGSIL